MSKRFAWLLGVVVLVSIGLLVACGSNYSASSDGLVVVGSQGSALMQTFSFNLSNGHVSAIYNPTSSSSTSTCVLPGLPSSIVVGPKGAFAYALIHSNSSCSGSKTGVQQFKLNSDGTMSTMGSLIAFNTATVIIQGTTTPESVAVVPGTFAMDAAGKFLFVADRATTDSAGRNVPGAVSVFAISNGSLTEVSGSPFFTTAPATTASQAITDLIAVAATPTVLPSLGLNGVSNSVCSDPGNNPPTSEFLYAADTLGNQVFAFAVNTSSGALGNPGSFTSAPSFPVGSVPSGVTVDPCARFVYVANTQSNNISAFTICNGLSTQSTSCPAIQGGDGSLVPVSGSPFSLSGGANGPGPLAVDPFGNYVYIVDTLSNQLSAFHISAVSGSLTALSPAVVATGTSPTSLAIRGDDNWLFVANYTAATVSQYAITPASGALTPQPTITTDNYPWGVAVK